MDEQLEQAAETTAETSQEASSSIPTDLSGVQQYLTDNSDLITTYAMKVIGVLVVLFIAWIIASWVARIINKTTRRAELDETLCRFFAKMARWAILLFAVLGCLGLFGVDVTSFAVVLGAAGFAIGMAFQGTLSNFAAGVMLLVFRPFKVGDAVSAGGVTGKIVEIALFTTIFDTPDNRRIIVPNGSIFGSTIENITFHDTRRVDVAVGVDYSADLKQTRDVLMQAAQENHDASTGNDPVVYLSELGASSVDYSVRVWAKTADYWAVREKLTESVKSGLDAANIGIPFPQMDVHLDQPQVAASA